MIRLIQRTSRLPHHSCLEVVKSKEMINLKESQGNWDLWAFWLPLAKNHSQLSYRHNDYLNSMLIRMEVLLSQTMWTDRKLLPSLWSHLWGKRELLSITVQVLLGKLKTARIWLSSTYHTILITIHCKTMGRLETCTVLWVGPSDPTMWYRNLSPKRSQWKIKSVGHWENQYTHS